MTSLPDPFDFHQAVQPDTDTGRDRIAVVTLVLSSSLFVQFEGEDTASTVTYPHLRNYSPRAGDRVWVRKIGAQWLVIDAIETEPAASPQEAFKAADESRTNTTSLSFDTDLLVTGAPNRVYAWEMMLHPYQALGTNTNPGFKWSLDLPTGADILFTIINDPGNAQPSPASLTPFMYGREVAAGVTFSTGLGPGGGKARHLQYHGTLFMGSQVGDITLSWAQITMSANSTFLLKGSRMSIRPLN